MSSGAPRLCPRGHIVPAGKRCARCLAAYEQRRRRDPAARARQDFYGSGDWKRFRASILAARPWCEEGCGQPSNEVAHIVPLRQRPDLALDPHNVRALCKSDHSRESASAASVGRDDRGPRKARGVRYRYSHPSYSSAPAASRS
jgi:5-methylcytosine-specific restriction protein A